MSGMKGIVLSGGLGTRLRPLTNVVSKQLLPVYNKPMIYYPMATLLNAEIKDIAIISSPDALPKFRELFDDGHRIGVNMEYIEQAKPAGISQAFVLAEEFIKDSFVTLILGDNIYHGQEGVIKDCLTGPSACAKLFGYKVANPSRYGVAEFDRAGRITNIIEKPKVPPSNVAITGLYQFDETAAERAKGLHPSGRGELEITDLNNQYIHEETAKLYTISGAWLDMGSPDGLLQASNYVQTIEHRQGTSIACLEEIAYKNRMIGTKELEEACDFYNSTEYGGHIKGILDGRIVV